jgi:hypothetical protein
MSPSPIPDPTQGAPEWGALFQKLTAAVDKLAIAGDTLARAIPAALGGATSPLGRTTKTKAPTVPPGLTPPGGWPSMVGAKAAKGAKGANAPAGIGSMMGKLGAFVKGGSPLGSGALARLATFSFTPAASSAPRTTGALRFGKLRGFLGLRNSLASTFPSSAFGRMGRRAARLKGMSAGLGKAAAGAKAAGLGGVGSALGGASALAGRGAALAGGPAGLAVAAVKVGVDFVRSVQGMTDEMLRAQERLARASGAMASVFAEREVLEILRDQRQGAKLAGTARDLSRGEQSLKDQIEPIETLMTNVKNTFMAPALRILADILSPVAYLAEAANRAGFGEPKEEPLAEALRRIADETERRRAAGDAAFARPDAAVHRP